MDKTALRLVGLFLAITGCFLVYSLIQERLMTLGFGPEQERFRHSLFIILVNRLVACAVAAAALGLLGKSLQPAAPLSLFAVPSLANVLGSASQYEALKYVSFPLQALAKCAKTVPVMAWGLVLGGRRYDAIDYGCALTVTFGCALFVLTGSIAAPQPAHAAAAAAGAVAGAVPGSVAAAGTGVEGSSGGGGVDGSGPSGEGGALALAAAAGALAGGDGSGVDARAVVAAGLLLLVAFLVFDGLTSTTQDKLFAQYDMHSCNQLLWVSAWSAAISLALLLAGGQLWPAVLFVARHPSALGYIFLLSAVSTAVQLFIFYTIQQYGALHFALIMTIRQFLSIVLSCLVFSHDLSASQWLGTALVIGGLLARGFHRGGLERTAVKTPKGAEQRRAAASSSGTGLLLPLITVPIIRQGSPDASLASVANELAAALAAAKKDGVGINVDVQAGGLSAASSLLESGSSAASPVVRSPGSKAGGKGPRAPTRRKGLDAG